MKAFLVALLVALSFNTQANIIVEANLNFDGRTFNVSADQSENYENNFSMNAEWIDFYSDDWPGYTFGFDSEVFDYITFPIFWRFDMVIDKEASFFNGSPVLFTFMESAFPFSGNFTIDENIADNGKRTFSGQMTGDFLAQLYYRSKISGAFVPNDFSLAVTLNQMSGNSIVFGQGNRLRFSTSAAAIGVNEPPIWALLLVVYLFCWGHKNHALKNLRV